MLPHGSGISEFVGAVEFVGPHPGVDAGQVTVVDDVHAIGGKLGEKPGEEFLEHLRPAAQQTVQMPPLGNTFSR